MSESERVARIINELFRVIPSTMNLISIGDSPAVTIAPLECGRHYVYLLTALASTGHVGVRFVDARTAYTMLPANRVKKAIRVNVSGRGLTIGDGARYKTDIIIDPTYYSAVLDEETFRLPYFAHPVFYLSGRSDCAAILRNEIRTMQIFFAGTIEQLAYSKGFGFPIMRRDSVFDVICGEFATRISASMESYRPITLISTNETADTIVKHKLDPEQYLEALSRSKFFICPPGWRMPNCHNMIEAMAVGAIPITNYADYMFPALRDGFECLRFSDAVSLCDAIERALHMSDDEIGEMRRAVLEYYDQFLDPVAVGTNIRSNLHRIKRIVVNDESGR